MGKTSYLLAAGIWLTACGYSGVSELAGPDSTRCGVTLNGINAIPPNQTQTTLQISTFRDCAWNAGSNVAWLQVSPANGQGEGPLSLTASANASLDTRTAVVMVNGASFQLTQASAGISANAGQQASDGSTTQPSNEQTPQGASESGGTTVQNPNGAVGSSTQPADDGGGASGGAGNNGGAAGNGNPSGSNTSGGTGASGTENGNAGGQGQGNSGTGNGNSGTGNGNSGNGSNGNGNGNSGNGNGNSGKGRGD
jgi:hypothetical protein